MINRSRCNKVNIISDFFIMTDLLIFLDLSLPLNLAYLHNESSWSSYLFSNFGPIRKLTLSPLFKSHNGRDEVIFIKEGYLVRIRGGKL